MTNIIRKSSNSQKIPEIPEIKKYPFTKMETGDYAEIVFKTQKELSTAQRCANMASCRGKYKFVTRKNGLTLRVWCIAKPDPFFGEV